MDRRTPYESYVPVHYPSTVNDGDRPGQTFGAKSDSTFMALTTQRLKILLLPYRPTIRW